MRTALLVPETPSPWTPPLFAALVNEFNAEVFPVAPRGPLPGLRGFDLVISRLKFRHLASMETIDWGDSASFKVHWEEDGFWDGLWSNPIHRGLWSDHFPRLGFDLLVVTGRRTEEYFLDRGIPSIVVHKGFDGERFTDHGRNRKHSIVMYGQDYASRILAQHGLESANHSVVRVKVPFERLSDELNNYLAALACTLDGRVVPGALFRRVAGWFPRTFIRTGPGPEPMLKFFESASSGCATFTDYSPDLAELGFVDGKNALIFSDVDDLVEKADYFMAQPDRLREIGRLGAAHCVEGHTWVTRAFQLRERLQPYL